MKHISILVPAGDAVVGSIEGPYKVFSTVNEILAEAGETERFAINLVGLSNAVTLNDGRITLHPTKTIHEEFETNLIIIPAVYGDFNKLVNANDELLEWIRRQYHRGAEVASLCVGAFLLAGTGLLSGKRCATHWLVANQFRTMFPDVILQLDKVIVDEGRIYSSGGAFSYLNLVLYLIEKYVGRNIAVHASKVFEIEIERDSQSPFEIFDAPKTHGDEPVRRVQTFIEHNYTARLTVDQLAAMVSLSRRNLERRFKKATGSTTLEYIQRVKVEAAKVSLERTDEALSDVMNSVGYSDRKAFRDIFRRITGLSPVDYKLKYSPQGRSLPWEEGSAVI